MKVRGVKITRSGLWSDGEFLCIVAADALDDVAQRVRRLGSRCYRNGAAAKRRADG